ncbi:CHAT domain-containing protein [Brachyspira hampsonii]|uniref:CHAT domain-containing protein n=1 Tax=Brachyspira hampsonii TaxID=1287055 RepID=A0A1E5NCD0_9SPIR|nr:CHAT domain-containing protein [Brachyspira hampsonii]OEJ13824.1 CHAT domain-containing protein [Brachyspira hampsonii]
MTCKSYIVTQNREYFLSHHIEYISLKNTSVKKIEKSLKKDESFINIFLYDNEKNKLYGYYEIDLNNKNNEMSNKDYTNIYITDNYKRRRGIYYKLEYKYSDFAIYEIDSKTFSKLRDRLILLNDNISQTFFSCSINDNIFKYQSIETYPSLYVAEYEKHFDNKAYESIYNEYVRLLKYANSENKSIDRYMELGSYLMNMLIPEKDFREHLLDGFRIVYLHLDDKTYTIPWEILSFDGKFLSENIIFSYNNASNVLHNKKIDNKKLKMAIISIPNEDILYDKREIDSILSLQNNIKNIEIDLYKKEHNYFEFVKILESYDIVHIITHGYKDGIKLSEDYILNSVAALHNPPSLIFINACNMEEADNKLTKSLLSSGVSTVISGIGSLADGMYLDFIYSFYSNLLHRHARINTAQAYYFAYVEVKEFYKGFIRYRFNGVPVYV